MSKGVSETFEEQEQDTTKRGVPRELVERATRTTKMATIDLEQLVRTESGTRPAVTADDLEKHARERMLEGFGLEPTSEVDAHSRPTIQATAFNLPKVQPPANPATTVIQPAEASAVQITPLPESRSDRVLVPRWLLTTMAVVSLLLIAVAGAIGYTVGRMTLHL